MGKPKSEICKRGHLLTPENRATGGECKICKNAATKRWQENNKAKVAEYNKTNKDRKREVNKIWHENNKEHCLALKKVWKENNAKRIAVVDKEYRAKNSEKEAERKAMWHKENEKHRLKYRAENAERIAENKKRWKDENPEKVLDSHHRRRAAKNNVVGERINLKSVYERDSWICQICGDVVNPNFKYPNSFSASLDHKIPLSKGGTHTFDNVRLTHFICNITKSNLTNEI